jgi:hypothetical protein
MGGGRPGQETAADLDECDIRDDLQSCPDEGDRTTHDHRGVGGSDQLPDTGRVLLLGGGHDPS